MKAASIGLWAAKAGSLALAIGAMAYFVVTAQRKADAEVREVPAEAVPALAGEPATVETAPTQGPEPAAQSASDPTAPDASAPSFLPSSKSLVVDPVLVPLDGDSPFLFGSKSGAISIELLEAPSAPNEDVFLPTSKAARPLIHLETSPAEKP